MKRLCIYYDSPKQGKSAKDFIGRVEWIVCKECQRNINAKKLALPEATECLVGRVPSFIPEAR